MSTTRQRPPKHPRHARWLRIGLVIAGIVSVLALVSMVQRAVLMVRSGHGLDTYRTFWLVEDNWVGFLVFAGSVLIALFSGLVIRWAQRRRERLQWRELEQKHGNRDAGA